ncbi:hypothetical protein [Bifidobacterium castoris]|uniref:Lipoprotein n=1 Tax=Bifidobacterium castoris TaxID=2306972 RepID=A0A430F4W0_9BIFI|nr:hypothetical protein [Bifidobacterium castoris]RSX44647.1 hypothetical protein D2E22_1933 [Bifidobacterium castoris]
MKNQTLKTGTAIVLVAALALTGSGCGQANVTEQAQVNVIEQAEEKCDIQSERGKEIQYAFSLDEGYGNVSTMKCLTNLMPDDVYEHYEADEKKAASYYETHQEPLRGQYDKDGYRWKWRMLFNTTYGPADERILYITKL